MEDPWVALMRVFDAVRHARLRFGLELFA